ncbi:hypothetical protein QAD02_013311 [Eretmocerus hayati]|uniref:Uncharacterized protein n=1 Tax=Eretmocerus hayati TaxID=131215 RepID=A0ACC2P4T2_9HYME|nr:hypothetical protein QAD02_013311 [Eretmocerus hayati]
MQSQPNGLRKIITDYFVFGIVPYSEAGKKFEECLSDACEPRDGGPISIFVTGDEEEGWLEQLASTFFSTHPGIEVIDFHDEFPVSKYGHHSMNYQFDPCVFHDNMRYRCALRTACVIAHVAAHCSNPNA